MPTVAPQAFPTLMASLVWLSLLHAAWIGLVIAACVAWRFQVGGMLSHRVRHDVLLRSLALVAVIPVVFAAMQTAATANRSEVAARGRAASFAVRAGASSELRHNAPPAQAGGQGDPVPSSSSLRNVEAILDRGVEWSRASQPYGLALWGLACLVGSLTLAFGVRGMGRLLRDSEAAPGRVIARAEPLARGLSLSRIPTVRVHPRLDQPCLCGVFRTAILLPEDWLSTAGPEILDAVLAHELAHFQRLDPLWNALQRMLDLALCFHPGVRWLSTSLRREREFAADALAVEITGDPLALARALESVARFGAGKRTPRLVGAAFRGQGPALLPRIQELLGMTPPRPRFPVWPFAALPTAIVLALVTASSGSAPDETAPGRQGRPPAPESLVFAIAVEENARQISYEVRFIETEPDVWREALGNTLKPTADRELAGRWIVEGNDAFERLIQCVMARPTSQMRFAPKVTTLESQHLMIRAEARADGQILPGATLKLSGTFLPGAIRMSLELGDPLQTSPRLQPRGPREAVERRLKDTFDLPHGSSLVLSLDRPRRSLGKRIVTSERLIVITPRRLDL